MIKRSKQRELIYDNLCNRYDHPTAEMLFEDLRKIRTNLSLGTVYRNLSLLVEIGQIQKISTEYGPDRFDGNAKPHLHFVCKNCGCVMDFPMEDDGELIMKASQSFAGTIESVNIQFVGICPDCCNKNMH